MPLNFGWRRWHSQVADASRRGDVGSAPPKETIREGVRLVMHDSADSKQKPDSETTHANDPLSVRNVPSRQYRVRFWQRPVDQNRRSSVVAVWYATVSDPCFSLCQSGERTPVAQLNCRVLIDFDQALLFQFRKCPAHCFYGQAEEVRDINTGHGQLD